MRWLSFAALVTVSCSACGGDDGDRSTVSATDFCARWAAAVCASADRCGCDAVLPVAGADCAPAAANVCPLAEGSALRMGVDDGSVAYDPLAAGALLDAISALPCDAFPPCLLSGCLGLSAEGGACGGELGCEIGLACSDGRCAEPPAMGLPDGEPCSEDAECESTRCDFSTGRCSAPAPSGELCADHMDCASGYCDRDLELGAGTCRDRVPDGGACDEDLQCLGGACIGRVCAAAICDELG